MKRRHVVRMNVPAIDGFNTVSKTAKSYVLFTSYFSFFFLVVPCFLFLSWPIVRRTSSDNRLISSYDNHGVSHAPGNYEGKCHNRVLCRLEQWRLLLLTCHAKTPAFLISGKSLNSVSSGGQCGRNSEGNLNNVYIFELS